MPNSARDLLSAPPPLQRRVMLAYGVGDAGTGMASALVGFYLFVFYTAVAGLPAWLAGSVLMVVRLWDVFSDQLIGWLGDRTRHRLGPRVPWMLWGSLPLGASMALMWWVPPFTGPWRLAWFVLIAATTFAFGHVVMHRWEPVLITFIGGVVFTTTLLRRRSGLLVDIEHAIYGDLAFTLGLGVWLYTGAARAGL